MQAVERTLLVLSTVASQPAPVTITQLADLTGLSVSTVHRYSAALVEVGYLHRNADKGFSLAGRGLALAASASGPDAVATRVRDSLRELRLATGETSFASQLAGHDVVCVAMERGTNPLQLSVRVGQTIPPLHAASARVVLAFSDQTVVRNAIARSPDLSPDGVDDFIARLTEIRSRGFDICDSEFDHGVWAVAAPVLPIDSGELFGSIAVAGSAATFSRREKRETVIDLVVSAASSVSARS